jgi:hypothetical protein
VDGSSLEGRICLPHRPGARGSSERADERLARVANRAESCSPIRETHSARPLNRVVLRPTKFQTSGPLGYPEIQVSIRRHGARSRSNASWSDMLAPGQSEAGSGRGTRDANGRTGGSGRI